ncbi:secreted RxLR effector protein 78-like [Nicotiana tomentosiformis]|uniref:secreted RxLR effector protein 78-like n=1 Tax=Nicotiana tomentosiformis TaxID=4098 RepID=UPI00388C9A77
MKKAYDSVAWGYLEQVLTYLQLPRRFVQWIMRCIKTVSYSIIINGQPTRPFQAKKGLRQGDPLSPYLFVLVMEYLTRLLKTFKRDPNFNYHPKCGKMNIVQLSFADDLLLFCRGDAISVQLLFQCFQKFSKA